MAGHSHTSSLADDYYTQSLSQYSHTSSLSNDSATALPYRAGSAFSQHQQPGVRKQASLASIHAPSFAAFRNQVSSIPVRNPAFQPARSPRAASFSLAEKASPRLADPSSRPLSLDSPLPQPPSGLAHVLSPPLTEELVAGSENRWETSRQRGTQHR